MKMSLALILFAAATVWAADPVPMDVKLGQWESTMTSQITGMPQGRGMPQIPPEQLARLPPEQRAKIEAMMAQMASGAPRTATTKSCIKREDLTKLPMNNDQSCKTTLTSSSSSKQVIQMDCDRNGNKQSGTMTIEALSSESIKFTVVGGASDASKGMNMSMNISGTSKWLSPVCADAK